MTNKTTCYRFMDAIEIVDMNIYYESFNKSFNKNIIMEGRPAHSICL